MILWSGDLSHAVAGGSSREHQLLRGANHRANTLYSTGTTTRLTNVEVNSPATTTRARGP